ncbi:MAG: hypothetical protein GY839_04500 [candidate division Zixibacteria bacterium]|nr:hypothetical protein [candidate division Zixibacteria bacterium]
MLNSLLNEKRDAILEKWFDDILESYPLDGAKFIKIEKDRFNNPVGSTISQEIKTIYGELLKDMNYEILHDSLEKIIKIRSVQDFTPSQALSFIFLLKKVLREELESEVADTQILRELMVFEARIDQLASLAFNVYSECREKIYDIRVNEIKKRSISFFRDTQNSPKAGAE